MLYHSEELGLQIEEATIVRYGEFKHFVDAETTARSAVKIWRLLVRLNKYAVLGKNDPFVSRSTTRLAPFMGSEIDLKGRPTMPHLIADEPHPRHFGATFALLEPLEEYMDPTTYIDQYGQAPHTYDAVKQYLGLQSLGPTSSPAA